MVQVINALNKTDHPKMVDAMLRDRKRVFVDLLRWNVPTQGDHEIDGFDDDHAEYLVICDPANGAHLGSLRLLRTDRPHILGSLFPHLCATKVPQGTAIREITRLCLSPRLRARDRLHVRNRLATALVEYGMLSGISSYTGVAEMAWLTQILALGWRCEPLGLPQPDGHSQIGALRIYVDMDSIARLRAVGTYATSELKLVTRERIAA